MHYSPLRYPGGKGKLSKFFKSVFEKNKLIDGYYVEPYAGGASIALALLINGFVSKVIINDFDRSIYAFWYSVIYNTKDLCSLIRKSKISIREWEKQRNIQRNKENANLLDLGFSTFFLNRTNRSGIINAGVIGGKDQKGNYKMNARFNKKELISRIKKIANQKDKILLYNLDAIELIRKISKDLPNNSLIYFDPPYYVKGKELYVNFYNHKDHLLVSKMIRNIKRLNWIVSYDNKKEIKNLYKGNKKIIYNLRYSAANTSVGSEVLIYHNNLAIPFSIRPPKLRVN